MQVGDRVCIRGNKSMCGYITAISHVKKQAQVSFDNGATRWVALSNLERA